MCKRFELDKTLKEEEKITFLEFLYNKNITYQWYKVYFVRNHVFDNYNLFSALLSFVAEKIIFLFEFVISDRLDCRKTCDKQLSQKKFIEKSFHW